MYLLDVETRDSIRCRHFIDVFTLQKTEVKRQRITVWRILIYPILIRRIPAFAFACVAACLLVCTHTSTLDIVLHLVTGHQALPCFQPPPPHAHIHTLADTHRPYTQKCTPTRIRTHTHTHTHTQTQWAQKHAAREREREKRPGKYEILSIQTN